MDDMHTPWERPSGDPAIRIAVLDGGIDATHPALRDARLIMVDGTPTRHEPTAHGTHIASLLFGQPASGVTGIAPACTGLIIPIFEETSSGLTPCSQDDLAAALHLAVDAGAHLVNVSAGELTAGDAPSTALTAAVERCRSKRVLIVAATGNDSCACETVPAVFPSVLAVGAMDAEGRPLEFSNWGQDYDTHGLLALGQDVTVAAPGGGIVVRSGTSYAVPMVAGTAAVLLSLERARGWALDSLRVGRALLESSRACRADSDTQMVRCLAGTLNPPGAARWLQLAEHPTEDPLMLPTTHHQPKERNDMFETPCEQTAPNATAPTTSSPLDTEAKVTELRQSGRLVHPTDSAPTSARATGVRAADCACSEGSTDCACSGASTSSTKTATSSSNTIYALGVLDYEFVSSARRDHFRQSMAGGNPDVSKDLLAFLAEHPHEAPGITWTLGSETAPHYVIKPQGPFAREAYERLQTCLAQQASGDVERVSLPGRTSGKRKLRDGREVSIVIPELGGIQSWSTAALVTEVVGPAPKDAKDKDAYERQREAVHNFLDRIYYELRNPGATPEHRAINFAATNAFQAGEIFAQAVSQGHELSDISAAESPTSRTGSDCWDVQLTFFDPKNRTEAARKVYRFTVDVSDVAPVTVGETKSWSVY